MQDIPGLTSIKVQRFLNMMCSNAETYLEVGSYIGATACAAIDGNNLDAYFVDNWKTQVQAYRDDIILPENNKETFIANIKQHKGNNRIKVFDCDMFDVDLSEIKPIDVFFYDGPHGFEETSRAIQYFSKALSSVSMIIVDDANFEGVIDGARDGITKSKLNVMYERVLLNSIEESEGWWNGLYIILVSK